MFCYVIPNSVKQYKYVVSFRRYHVYPLHLYPGSAKLGNRMCGTHLDAQELVVVKRIRPRRSDVKTAELNPPTAGHLPDLVALFWPRSPS